MTSFILKQSENIINFEILRLGLLFQVSGIGLGIFDEVSVWKI